MGRTAIVAGGNDNFIFRVRIEDAQARHPGAHLPFTACFNGGVGGRLQSKVKPGLTIGTIGQLVNGRRFKSPPGREVNVPLRRHGMLQRCRRKPLVIARFAAIITIFTYNITIVGIKPYRAIARPGVQPQGWVSCQCV